MVYTIKPVLHLPLRATFGLLLRAQTLARTLGTSTSIWAIPTTTLRPKVTPCVASGGIKEFKHN